MAFVNKFKSGNTTNEVPVGVNLAHTSFGYAKNQQYVGIQPTKVTTIKQTKPRGGWDDDDEEDEQPQIKTTQGPYRGNETQSRSQPISDGNNPSQNNFEVQSKKKVNPTTEYALLQCDYSFIAKHEYENNMINELIQPGGARIRQPDKLLNDFCQASENFQAAVIGSLLLCKFNEEIADVSKARTLFLIEAIVKKVPKYFEYFKYNLNILRNLDFSNEGSNSAQLEKVKQDIIQHIEGINQPKQISSIKPTKTIPTTVTTQNLLDGEDLLDLPEPQKKQDPFAFVNTQTMKPNPEVQIISPQVQTQPKKFDPFALGNLTSTTSQNLPQNTTKPSSGPSINFKKFQSGASQEQNKPVVQPKESQQMNNLIGALSGLDFIGGGSPSVQSNEGNKNLQQKPVSNQLTNHQTKSVTPVMNQGMSNNLNTGFSNNMGFSNGGNFSMNNQPSFNPSYGGPGGYNQYSNGNLPQGNYGFNAYPNNNFGYNQYPYGNGGFGNSSNLSGANYQGGSFGFNGAPVNSFSNNQAYSMANEKGIDELYNLVHQELRSSEEDKKKKLKEENEKAFDSLKF